MLRKVAACNGLTKTMEVMEATGAMEVMETIHSDDVEVMEAKNSPCACDSLSSTFRTLVLIQLIILFIRSLGLHLIATLPWICLEGFSPRSYLVASIRQIRLKQGEYERHGRT